MERNVDNIGPLVVLWSLMPTVVAGVGFLVAFVGLSVCQFFPTWYLKNCCNYDYQTWHRDVPLWVLSSVDPFILESKGQRSRLWGTKNSAAVGFLHFCECWLFLVLMVSGVQIYKRGRVTHWVDGRDPNRSNWLRYINCASSVESQNMTAFQTGGDIYYRTVQAIRPNTELLVWYGDDYAMELGLISVSFSRSLDVITLCKMSPVSCCLFSLCSCFCFVYYIFYIQLTLLNNIRM